MPLPKLKIVDEIHEGIELATEEEDAALSDLIKKHRVTFPIVCGANDVILDGRRRYRFAKKHRLKDVPVVIFADVKTKAQQIKFIKDWNRGTRGWSLQRKSLARGLAYNQAKPRQGQNLSSATLADDALTAAEMAEKTGVSERTIQREGKKAEDYGAFSDQVQAAFRNDQITLNKNQMRRLSAMSKANQNEAFKQVRVNSKQWEQVLPKATSAKKPKANGKPKKPRKEKTRRQIHAERVTAFHSTLCKFAPAVDDYCRDAELTKGERKHYDLWLKKFGEVVINFAKWKI